MLRSLNDLVRNLSKYRDATSFASSLTNFLREGVGYERVGLERVVKRGW